MCRFILPFMVLALVLFPLVSASQIYPPKPGVEMPQAYFDRIKENPKAFQFKHAWIDKSKRIKRNRMMQSMTSSKLQPTPSYSQEGTVVSGTIGVPVFMVKFHNTGANPYPASNLQTELFDGPWATGTMTEFYNEISYGNLSLTGTVHDWFQLNYNDTYYEGSNNGIGPDSKVGELLKETLDYWDSFVDFGQYDNDGPDGIPNSGDDDGYVDFVSFVHAESGGECGNSNIWSHRWSYSGWWGSSYTTNDARSGGGSIKVEDYTIQPALACDGTTMIQIGVFCHEFGHTFGLPDLYDTNAGSQGLGHWALMASGPWNQPASPSHMCAWSKMELGWINPIEVGPAASLYPINNSEFNPQAYKLPVIEERWRRSTLCALSGSYSMHLGLSSAEASARNWPLADGYGNGWNERLVRDFSYNGSIPVTLSYDYAYSLESNYDYAYVKINVNGSESTLRTYTGSASGTEGGINLSSYLSGSGASTYEIIFEFKSDYYYSDEDGNFNSGCGGPVTIDNISLTGGGESYLTDFESYEDGWHEDTGGTIYPGGVEEFFLVENREPLGFDQYLHGPGLAVYHVNEDVATTYLGNTGGSLNNETRGVLMEEADGLWQMLNNVNRGDAGDVFPGSSMNVLFDNSTNPSSLSSESESTMVSISAISSAGNVMTAVMRAGAFPPTADFVSPASGDNSSGIIHVSDLLGTGINYCASFHLRNSTGADRIASSVEWIGHGKLSGDIDLTGLLPGTYDVVIINPDGQEGVLADGFIVTGATGINSPGIPGKFALYQNYPNPFNPMTTIPFDLKEQSHVTLRIYEVTGRLVKTLIDGQLPADHYEVKWNGVNDAGEAVSSGIYFYKIKAGSNFAAAKKMVILK
jgi:M6 family metalloprotease-like protein